ncbi:MAG TPA: tripartite tricarboxylate transporter substrate binding protein [Burkholderiales bacterium]|nr:tripartite tricarboxylate transporter substrate binding protein [Burkholderiales bacterium]
MKFAAMCGAAVMTLAAGVSIAQSYPAKPVRLVVPFPPGGPADSVARILAQKLTDALGQNVVVDNRAGATGTIGAGIVAKSPPDGYTLLLGTSNELAMSPGLFEKLPYEPTRDFTPLSNVINFPNILVVNPHLPARSVTELVALARAKPGQLSFATSGIGSTNHLTGVVFQEIEKVKINYVPYKGGGPAVTDLMGGHVDTMFATMPSVVPFVKGGKLKALVLTDNKRWTALPEVPSAKEAGVPGLIVITWNGVLAPAGLPDAIVARLNTDIGTVANSADMKDRMRAQAAEIGTTTPEEFAAMLRNDYAKWSKVIKQAGLRAE